LRASSAQRTSLRLERCSESFGDPPRLGQLPAAEVDGWCGPPVRLEVMLRRPRKARALGFSTLCVLLSCACIARAADQEADGRALFESGVKSYQAGQYAAAIVAFSEAYRITKRPGLLFSLAQAFRHSYEQTHEPTHLREAVEYYKRYLATNASGERRAEAASWLQRLDAPPNAQAPSNTDAARAQLVIAVNVPSARLRLDGHAISRLPHAADVAPGKHHLEVTAEGYAPYERDVEVPPAAVLPINVELVRAVGRVQVLGVSGAEVLIDGVRVGELPSQGFFVAAGRHTVEVRQRGYYTLRQTIQSAAGVPQTLRLSAAPTTRRTASWVLVGAGAAATLAGGVLGYLALRKQANAESLQDQPGMAPAFEQELGARDDLRLAAAVTAGVGGAAGVAGLLSVITEGFGPTRSPPGASSPRSAIGVALSGTF
jgi:hypothetical protein